MITNSDIAELKKIFPEPDFRIVEISDLGEPKYIAIRTEMEISDMRRAGVKFKILEDDNE